MLLVGRPQSFLEPNLQPGKPPVLTCPSCSDPRAVFRLLNAISNKKNTSQDSSFRDCTCPLDTAKHFASYLRSRLSQATPRSSRRAERQFMNELRKASCEDASSLHNSFCSPFSLTELSTAISNFSSSTASGPDQIAYPLLKHLPEPAQLLLLSFFDRSWHSHTLPLLLETYHYHPIHKPGKPTFSPFFFRPISLTSCISKLIERLILSGLTFHLESNHLLSTCQAGFSSGRSPLDQILSQSSGTASKRKNLQTERFWLLLTSPRLWTWSGTLLFFTNSSRSNSPLASFFGCAPSFLIVELKSRLVVPTAALSASDVGSPGLSTWSGPLHSVC